MRRVASQITPAPQKPRIKAGRPRNVIKGSEAMNTHAFITKASQNKAARAQSKALRTASRTKKTKLPMDQRLARASATATRIEQRRWAASNAATAELTRRRGIALRAGKKAKMAAWSREEAAGKASALAMRSAQRASTRASGLRAANAAAAKPVVKGRVSRLGSRIDPAKQANRKATAAVDRAMAAERKAMNVAMRTKGEFTSPARQAANRRVDETQRETASLIQTRRNIRAQFGVTTKNKPIKGARPGSTISSRAVGASAKKAKVARAQANLANAQTKRSAKGARSRRVAKKALQFMANPRSAVKNRSMGLGFRMPRSVR